MLWLSLHLILVDLRALHQVLRHDAMHIWVQQLSQVTKLTITD